MNFKKNVYVVFTEYQYIQALNIATSVYNSPEFINSIYLVRNGDRLQGIDGLILVGLNNIKIQILDFEEPKNIAQLIFAEKPDHFFFFQAISTLNVHIAHKLSKKGVEISLGPDGYNAYAIFDKKHHFLSMIRDSFQNNIFMIKNNLFSGKIHRFDYYKYGNNSFIQNLWITHPSQYIHQAKNKVNILKLPDFNQTCVEFIRKSFKFNIEFISHDVIYFFNQPLWGLLADKELEFLKEVINAFPQRKIIVKLHPLTSEKIKESYKALNTLEILSSSVPAEVILLNLRNCIVYTGWSSVLITENKKCNYYFNYPIFKTMGDPILNQVNIVQLNHIKMIQSPQEMSFPNE